ncbi:MAG: VTT domain-containing protein [Candidatus Paceibacterota bacterium]
MLPTWITKYFFVALFVGMISAGEITLIPAVYLGYMSGIALLSVLGVALLGSLFSDTFWYCIGRRFPKQRLMRYRLIQRETARAEKLKPFYDKHKLRMIFLSKFLFGTGIFFQVLAGMNHVPYRHYILASTSATLVWFGVATVFGVILGASIDVLKDVMTGAGIAATATLIVTLLSYAGVYWFTKRKLSFSRASR